MFPQRFWFILQQDVERPIGGVKQFYVLASIFSELGLDVTVVQGTSGFRPSWFSLPSHLKIIGSNDFNLALLKAHSDVLVLPETFLPYLRFTRDLKIIIFNQNMHFLFGEKLDTKFQFVFDCYSSDNVLAVLTVSSSDHAYVVNHLPVSPSKVFRIFNAIESSLFEYQFSCSKVITYMPRKNADHSRIVTSLVSHQSWFLESGWSFLPIHNVSHSEVASLLASSSIYLSFGFPEGFGLPLAESIISGNLVVGYDGIGGREIYNMCKPYNTFIPVEFRDFSAFCSAIRLAVNQYDNISSLDSRLKESSSLLSSRYCYQSMVSSVEKVVSSLSFS